MDQILTLVYFEDNQIQFCQHVLEMTYFQRITFHNFRFQRNTIPRSSGISLLTDLEENICFILCLISSFPVSLIAFEKPAPPATLARQALCSCQLACPVDGGQEQSPFQRLGTNLFWTLLSEIPIWISVPDTHSFVTSRYSRQLMLHFFYYSDLLLTMKKMMSFPGCDKGLILYAVKTMSQQFLRPWGHSIQQFWKQTVLFVHRACSCILMQNV